VSVQQVDLVAVAPVLVAAATMLVLLLVQAVRPGMRLVLDLVALGGVLGSAGAVVLAGADGVRATFCADGGVGAARQCSFVADPLTVALQVVVLVTALAALLLALDGPGADGRGTRGEHHALLLATVTGALALAGARDLATLVVALETASLPVVGLVALRRDAVGAEAATKLVLVSVTSFGLLVLGVALLYAGTGTLALTGLAAATAGGAGTPLVVLGAALVVAGAGYKVAALPFGLWVPDVYAGSPVPVAALLSTVSKVAGLSAVALVLVVGLPGASASWAPWLGVLVLATMTVGNLVALAQTSAVRLLAWSTVAQAGWVLLPLVGAGGRDERVGAAALYLLAYGTATAVAFAVVVLVTRHHVAGSSHLLADYRGLVRREPVAAVLLGLSLLSLAGLPPGIAGLVAKLAALAPVADAGTWWLAVGAAVNVALGLAYYLRWTALLVAAPSEDEQPVTWSVRPAEGAALGFSGVLLVAFSVVPGLMLLA
jgi:NADH-quinone oxidoreductase subunit N